MKETFYFVISSLMNLFDQSFYIFILPLFALCFLIRIIKEVFKL